MKRGTTRSASQQRWFSAQRTLFKTSGWSSVFILACICREVLAHCASSTCAFRWRDTSSTGSSSAASHMSASSFDCGWLFVLKALVSVFGGVQQEGRLARTPVCAKFNRSLIQRKTKRACHGARPLGTVTTGACEISVSQAYVACDHVENEV